MKGPRFTKEHWQWVVLACFVAIFYCLGKEDFQLKHTEASLIIAVVLSFILPLAISLIPEEKS